MRIKRVYPILFTVILLSFTLSVSSFATNLKTYRFTINGADLMSYKLQDTEGNDENKSAADNGIYNGARYYKGRKKADPHARNYISSEKDKFNTWATTTTARLTDFNIWGYDGNGANWGEIYKVYDWPEDPVSDSAAWSGYRTPWPWGSFDDYADKKIGYGAHYNDGELLGWESDYANGLGFNLLNNIKFTFQIVFDMDDPAFDNNTSPWYNGKEGQMVVWFGGGMADKNDDFVSYYEGNIILQGTPVPEPATILLFALGILGFTGLTRKKA